MHSAQCTVHSGHKAKLNEVLNEIKYNSKLYLICISCCALILNYQFIYYIYNHLIRLNFSTLISSTVQACLQSELAPLHIPPPFTLRSKDVNKATHAAADASPALLQVAAA